MLRSLERKSDTVFHFGDKEEQKKWGCEHVHTVGILTSAKKNDIKQFLIKAIVDINKNICTNKVR
jgi:hypothetical protein